MKATPKCPARALPFAFRQRDGQLAGLSQTKNILHTHYPVTDLQGKNTYMVHGRLIVCKLIALVFHQLELPNCKSSIQPEEV